MNYIVAGITVIFTMLVALWSYRIVEIRNADDKASEPEDGIKIKDNKHPATMLFEVTKRLSLSQWIFIVLCTVLNGLATVKLVMNQTDNFTCARLIVALLILFSALLIDRYTRTIPNGIIIIMMCAGMIVYGIRLFVNVGLFKADIISALVGMIGNLFLFYLMSRLTKDGIGMGDVKLIAALGWLTGFSMVVLSVLLGLILCSVVALVLILFRKKNASDSVPFGPFIYFGYIIALILCNI